METQKLRFEPLTAGHAAELFLVLNTPEVQAFIEPRNSQTIAELKTEFAIRAKGPTTLARNERWFNMAVRLKGPSNSAIGRLEATSYGSWGEVAYLFGKHWWGKGIAFEAMNWWHGYLAKATPDTQWWATVTPENSRSIRLLKRLGYIDKTNMIDRPKLQSYEAGDLCFVRAND